LNVEEKTRGGLLVKAFKDELRRKVAEVHWANKEIEELLKNENPTELYKGLLDLFGRADSKLVLGEKEKLTKAGETMQKLHKLTLPLMLANPKTLELLKHALTLKPPSGQRWEPHVEHYADLKVLASNRIYQHYLNKQKPQKDLVELIENAKKQVEPINSDLAWYIGSHFLPSGEYFSSQFPKIKKT